MGYEYRVVRDYHNSEWDFDLVAGDIVTDDQFPEPDIPGGLVGRGILEPANTEVETERLSGDHLWMVDEGKKSKVQKIIDQRAKARKMAEPVVLDEPEDENKL